jgi:hypothetical protein
LPAAQLVRELGENVLGTDSYHSSTQLYAYENLIKSLAETSSKKDLDTITEEIIFDIAVEKNPVKRAYLLGILSYYSGQERLNEIENKIRAREISASDEKTEEEIKIISNLRSSILRLQKVFKGYPEMEEIINYALKDFKLDNDECEWARLIANYYKSEPHVTRMPDLEEKYIIAPIKEIQRKSQKGSGLPKYVYTLPPGYHPSQEKLEEADRFGIQLTFEAVKVVNETKEGKKKKIFVEYDMSPELSRLYYRRIRHYKDKVKQANNPLEKKKYYKRINDLEAALKKRIWKQLDPEAKKIFGSPDNIEILKKTIRDWSDDEETQKLLEEEQKLLELEKEEDK